MRAGPSLDFEQHIQQRGVDLVARTVSEVLQEIVDRSKRAVVVPAFPIVGHHERHPGVRVVEAERTLVGGLGIREHEPEAQQEGSDFHMSLVAKGHGGVRPLRDLTMVRSFVLGAALWLLSSAAPAVFAADANVLSQLLRDHVERLVVPGVAASEDVASAAPEVLLAFYQSRAFAPAWDDARARAFLELVANAGNEGLDPADYLYPTISALPALSTMPEGERVAAELELTEAFLRYAYHRRFGKVNPTELDPTWNYARSVSAGGPYAALDRVLAASDMRTQLETEVGLGPVYKSTRRVLERYRALAAAGGWSRVPGGSTLKPGMTDARVGALRTRLAAEGFGAASAAGESVFDADLEAALRDFQLHHGLGTDGVLGKLTLDELNVGADELV